MIINKVIAVILLLTFCFSAQAQYGNLQIIADGKVEQLVHQHKRYHQINPTVEGFRVQIIQDSNRENVRQQKVKLQQMFPQYKIYETYSPPFFKIRVGDFDDRFTAYKAFKELKRSFKLAFIVTDRVNISEIR